jgi:hypothetical protein
MRLQNPRFICSAVRSGRFRELYVRSTRHVVRSSGHMSCNYQIVPLTEVNRCQSKRQLHLRCQLNKLGGCMFYIFVVFRKQHHRRRSDLLRFEERYVRDKTCKKFKITSLITYHYLILFRSLSCKALQTEEPKGM